jgi:outer membrane autotransporter protein
MPVPCQPPAPCQKIIPCCHTPGHFDVIGGVSLSKVQANGGQLGVTANEIDRLVQTNQNQWNSWGAQLGLGYVYYIGNAKKLSSEVQWFPMIEPEINLYYSDYQSNGQVYRYNSVAFNDLTYEMPVPSTRVMLDLAVTVVSWCRFSTYAIGGIGNAWNRVSYSDSVNSGDTCDLQTLNLHSRTNSNFAWELGAGVNYAFNDCIGVSAEYLYTDFGKLKTPGSGNTGDITSPNISPASFNLHTQGVLVGLHVALG